jgi:multiple sugar transport system ATP-binding protein
MENKLVLSHVYKNYGKIEAVKDVSISVNEQEFISILGPSGCGKSSTLRMIAGLEEITDGEIILDNKKINNIPARNRNIALCFENYALYTHLDVFNNLSFPLEVRGLNKKDIYKKVKSIISLLELENYQKMFPEELGGGELQKVALGRALIRDASIYLLDEALSHLDTQSKIDLRARLLRIQKLNKLTFILVTHDQSEAVAMSDRVVVMNDGEIQQIGKPEDLYNNPYNLFVADFIGEPPMNLIEGTLVFSDDNQILLHCKNKDFTLPTNNNIKKSNKDQLLSYKDQRVIMGIRPQYIDLVNKDKTNAIEGVVYSYEYLGEKGLLLIDCKGEKFLIEIDHTGYYYKIDEKISLYFREEHVHIFDSKTGQRIL